MSMLSIPRVVLAGTAALGIATAAAAAQTTPNVAGHWVPVANTAADSTTLQSFTIEQSPRTLAFTMYTGNDEGQFIYTIDRTDRSHVTVKGPTAITIHGVEVALTQARTRCACTAW